MSVFLLLLLGVGTTAAGLALVVSGATIHEGAFDTDVITPGTIAAVGGLLLVGIALAVRELQRIERALAARPMPRSARLGEAPVAAMAQSPDSAVRSLFPLEPTASPSPQPSPETSAAPAPADDAAIERLRAKFPTLARIEGGPVVEGADVSLMLRAPIRAAEEVGEATQATTIGRVANGPVSAGVTQRPSANPRPPASPARAKGSVLNAFWPARPRRNAQTAATEAAVPPPIKSTPVNEEIPGASAIAGPQAAPAPISILKSGVVEGLAYTLYSDGSIEAQLPQGTFRFGSITALRDHIESGS